MRSQKSGILTIAYYFDPERAVGALRPRRFHRYLGELGYDSRVVAAKVDSREADPNVFHLPDITGDAAERRSAEVAAGKPPEALSFHGQIERGIRGTIMPGHSGWIWSRDVAAFGARLVRDNPNVTTVLSSYPAIGTHLAALQLARRAKLRWIADFRDPFPPYGSTLGLWSQRRFEWIFMRSADAIIANTEPVATTWRRRYPWATDKIHLIWNGYDPNSEVEPLPTVSDGWKRIVHTGNLYAGRNANAILSAIAHLRERRQPGIEQVKVILAGPVAPEAGLDMALHEHALAEGWLEMNRAHIPKAEALRLTQAADGLLLLQPQSSILIPAKLFEYTSVGRPILALAPSGSAIEWILQRSGLPFACVHATDTVDVAATKVAHYLTFPNTPVSANDWFRRTFNARNQTQDLAQIVEQINLRTPPV